MATSPLSSLLLILAFLPPLLAAANLRTAATIFRSHPISEPAVEVPPITYFEVTKPIQLPKTQPCSYLVLQHDFASTYGKPPVLASYKPPSDCPSQNFAKIVLEWTATSKGRQYDRIFGVWVGGVEILRSCTAEPRATGIVWTVKKDITRYKSLLNKEQTLAVYMGNIIDSTYTGVYHVNVSIHFYPAEENYVHSHITFGKLDNETDLILPISRNLPLNDGLWFEIENSTDIQGKEITIPQNAYRAVLEVYVSFHENDEFWFGNYPNEYISVNNLTEVPGNGPFREVVVSLDDVVVGAIWPFTVIYTGGVNPLLWRPISGIGSFDLPTYDIEITPFLGRILDQKGHKFAFRVTNALNVWYIDANLHLWLDKKWERTQGKVLEHRTSPIALSLLSNFTGFDGSFVVNATRSIVSSGWVRSSHGVITTKSHQKLKYGNAMILGNNSNLQILEQIIKLQGSVRFKIPLSSSFTSKLLRKFGVYLYYDVFDKDGAQVSNVNVSLSIKEKSQKSSGLGSSSESRLNNLLNANGYLVVKGKSISGLGRTRQDYSYLGDKSCYFRHVESSNYTVLEDEERRTCKGHDLGSFDIEGPF